MPVAIGVAMPELSGTEVAAACFSEAKAYGLCTLSPFSLKKYKEFLFENISPKAEAVA